MYQAQAVCNGEAKSSSHRSTSDVVIDVTQLDPPAEAPNCVSKQVSPRTSVTRRTIKQHARRIPHQQGATSSSANNNGACYTRLVLPLKALLASFGMQAVIVIANASFDTTPPWRIGVTVMCTWAVIVGTLWYVHAASARRHVIAQRGVQLRYTNVIEYMCNEIRNVVHNMQGLITRVAIGSTMDADARSALSGTSACGIEMNAVVNAVYEMQHIQRRTFTIHHHRAEVSSALHQAFRSISRTIPRGMTLHVTLPAAPVTGVFDTSRTFMIIKECTSRVCQLAVPASIISARTDIIMDPRPGAELPLLIVDISYTSRLHSGESFACSDDGSCAVDEDDIDPFNVYGISEVADVERTILDMYFIGLAKSWFSEARFPPHIVFKSQTVPLHAACSGIGLCLSREVTFQMGGWVVKWRGEDGASHITVSISVNTNSEDVGRADPAEMPRSIFADDAMTIVGPAGARGSAAGSLARDGSVNTRSGMAPRSVGSADTRRSRRTVGNASYHRVADNVLRGFSIVVVDDSTENLGITDRWLKEMTVRPKSVEVIDNVADLQVLLCNETGLHNTVIFLDIHMHGTKTVPIMSRHKDSITCTVVAMTGSVEPDSIMTYEAAGFAGVLGKPFDRAHFTRALHAALLRHVSGGGEFFKVIKSDT